MKISLDGSFRVTTAEGIDQIMTLPGTLDEAGIGHPDRIDKPWHPDLQENSAKAEKVKAKAAAADHEAFARDSRIPSRLTRVVTYEGAVHFTSALPTLPTGGRLFLIAERARALTLQINGTKIPCRSGSLSTPYCFELTGLAKSGDEITLTTDNTYPALPYQDIVFSSAATDESQTNWNGIVGELYLEQTPDTFIDRVLVYPHRNHIDVTVRIDAKEACAQELTLRLTSPALSAPAQMQVSLSAGQNCVTFTDLALTREACAQPWDEFEGNLSTLCATVLCDGEEISAKEVTFGIRTFGDDGHGHLALNGRRIFLRSEANCAFFPETGYPPMDKASWITILKRYISYGANAVRFHSYCPPEAAFAAADELGILLQPELSHWNPRNAFSSKESRAYYRHELCEILTTYGDHPSFVMLSLGNELDADEDGISYMHELMALARSIDPTRRYAWGSNNYYGKNGTDPESDFYTSSSFKPHRLRLCGNRGPINITYANNAYTFDETMRVIREEGDFHKPVFGFEVGQYQVLPDLKEIDTFRGVTRADNLQIVADRKARRGISDADWEKRVALTGEIALMGYRHEVEAALLTEDYSGLSLLGLQDFPGQGTALVGMMNSHLLPKPYPFAQPERFASFFKPVSALLQLEKYTYTDGETLTAKVSIANYGRQNLTGDVIVTAGDQTIILQQNCDIPQGHVTLAGTLSLPLTCNEACVFPIRVFLDGEDRALTDAANTYEIWIYPDALPQKPAAVYETRVFDTQAKKILERGGSVYLTPPSTIEAMPNSIRCQFTTDFWSVGTFANNEGAMGQLIDASHPLFAHFPTTERTDHQWYPMASQRALILPHAMDAIITEMDTYFYLRPMAQLLECNCGGGRLLISSMGLQDLQEYPEARALLSSIYSYLDSPAFAPAQSMTPEEVTALFTEA